jgi:hypothetical protein
MSEIVNHKNSKAVAMQTEKFDKDEMIDKMTALLTKMSDEIISHDPKLIEDIRQDLMYTEDAILLWKVPAVKRLHPDDMYTVHTLVTKRAEQQRFNPQFGRI